MDKNREGYLDSCKGWAVLMVIIVHSGLWTGEKVTLIANAGARGCQLFFVVSGYLIYKSYDLSVCKSKTVQCGTIKWILKRFIRLGPLWYLSIFVHLLTHGWSAYWLGSMDHITAGNLVAHLLFLHGLSPYYANSIMGVEWYVGVISIFILLMPVIYWLTRNSTAALWCILFGTIIFRYGILFWGKNFLCENDAYLWQNYIGTLGFWNQIPVLMTGVML